MKNLLLVEDEHALADSLSTEFKFENFNVFVARDGLEGLQIFAAEQDKIDIIILDWMLPKLNGIELLREIRKNSQVPVIMLTARDYISDKVMGLSGGADDYVTKPFEMEELLVRIQVALRHAAQNANINETLAVGNLAIDSELKRVTVDNKIISLTPREYELLLYLVEHQDESCARGDLLDAVWGVDFVGQPNIIDAYIRNLRHKLPVNLIHTIRNQGYMISANYLENK